MEGCETIELITSDGHKYVVLREVAVMSKTLRNMLEDDIFNTSVPIPLSGMNDAMLEHTVRYCMHHKDDPPTVPATTVELIEPEQPPISEWDQQFVAGFDFDQLCELLTAVNYMDIPPLYTLCARTIATIVQAVKDIKEVPKLFGIERELTAEEEKEAMEQTPWIRDENETPAQ